jgi:hypothetical protein
MVNDWQLTNPQAEAAAGLPFVSGILFVAAASTSQ